MTVSREEFIASVLTTDPAMTREIAERLADHDLPRGRCDEHGGRDLAACLHGYDATMHGYDATIPRDGGDDASYQEWRKLQAEHDDAAGPEHARRPA